MFPEVRNSKDLADLPCRHIKGWRWERRSVLYAGQRKMTDSVCVPNMVSEGRRSLRGALKHRTAVHTPFQKVAV